MINHKFDKKENNSSNIWEDPNLDANEAQDSDNSFLNEIKTIQKKI